MKAAQGHRQGRAEKTEGATVTIAVQAGEKGKLFGSIGIQDIADALQASGHEV